MSTSKTTDRSVETNGEMDGQAMVTEARSGSIGTRRKKLLRSRARPKFS